MQDQARPCDRGTGAPIDGSGFVIGLVESGGRRRARINRV